MSYIFTLSIWYHVSNVNLKVSKREIFVTEFLHRAIPSGKVTWGMNQKIDFSADIRHCCFSDDWVICKNSLSAHWAFAKNYFPRAESSPKIIIFRMLSHWQKYFSQDDIDIGLQQIFEIFRDGWVFTKKYFPWTDCSLKIIFRELNVRKKNFPASWVFAKNELLFLFQTFRSK
jgi:hypothetical protein